MQKTMTFSSEKMDILRSSYRYAKRQKVVTNLSLIMRFIDKYFQYANSDKYFFDYVLDKFLCFIPSQQLTVDEKGFIAPCVFLSGECSIYNGNIYDNWRNLALKYREILKKGGKFQVCKSCSCHFAENYRSSIIAYPLANWSHLWWFLAYYSKRLFYGEGRKI